MGLTFEEYAAERLDSLFRSTAVLTGDRGLAEDIVQEVLIRVRRDWQAIEAMERRDAYVRRMVVNEFLSWRRKWSRIVPVAEVRLLDRPVADVADQHAEHDSLIGELTRLPRQQRAAVVLRFYDGLTDEETALIMGCRAVTVRGYVSRALRTLRIAVGPTADTRRPHRTAIKTKDL